MRNLLKLTDLQPGEVYEIFRIADEVIAGKSAWRGKKQRKLWGLTCTSAAAGGMK